MEQNKTRTYLKYAIGEITLVMIGILLALQVNNWNEGRKDQERSKQYLERMIDELDLFTSTLTQDSLRAEVLRMNIASSIQILKGDHLSAAQKDTLDFSFLSFNQFVQIPPSLTSFDEMKSNGDLGLIYSQTLRKQINDYNRYLEAISRIYDRISGEFSRQDFVKKYLTFVTNPETPQALVTYNFEEMKGDRELINTFSSFARNWQTKRGFNHSLSELSKELKLALENEIAAY